MPPSVIDARGALGAVFELIGIEGARRSLVLVFSSDCEASVKMGKGAGPVFCAVVGRECGSVSCELKVEMDNGGRTRVAVEGRLGVGRNDGTVGDSGCVSCKVVTSEN